MAAAERLLDLVPGAAEDVGELHTLARANFPGGTQR
jgi:hypothetical protein